MRDFNKAYVELNDGELISLAEESDSLAADARQALWDELARRGLKQEATRLYQARLRETQPRNDPPPNIVTLAAFHDPMKARLVKTRLESEGVECFLQDQNIVELDSWAVLAFGGVKLCVKEDDVARAVEILGPDSEIIKTANVWVSSSRRKNLVEIVLLWLLAGFVITLVTYLLSR